VAEILWHENDNLVELAKLRSVDGAYINDATVTLESLVDNAGTAVTGITPPLAMAYVATSDGTYRVVLPHTLGVVIGQYYVARVRVISGALDANLYKRFVCRKRIES
jgi:hypothetical protein